MKDFSVDEIIRYLLKEFFVVFIASDESLNVETHFLPIYFYSSQDSSVTHSDIA